MRTSPSYSLRGKDSMLFLLLALTTGSGTVMAQNCTSADFGTVTSTSSCLDFDAIPSGPGNACFCNGNGFGGQGIYRIARFSCNASASCISFDITGLSASNGVEVSLWTGCASGTTNGYITNSAACFSGNTSISWSTAGLNISTNTIYYLRVWTKTAPTANAFICARSQTASNDICSMPVAIGTTAGAYDNYCMTAGNPSDPPASEFCAFSLENNAWFSFTTLPSCSPPCSATIEISSIVCSGGGSGFQIGWWSGSCGSLTNLGCVNGSGGNVTATINGLTPGQTVLVGIDGSLGSYCNFSIAGLDISAMPVALIDFTGSRFEYGVGMAWETLSEKDNSYYAVERSLDGNSWSEIYREYTESNSSVLQSYQCVDYNAPKNEVVYYRLKQADINEHISVLKTVAIDALADKESIKLIPNPVSSGSEIINVEIRSLFSGYGIFAVSDDKGRVLFIEEREILKGINIIKFDVGEFIEGVYFVDFSNCSSYQFARFVRL